VLTREDTYTIIIMNERQESVTLRDAIITPNLVEKKLIKLNASKSAGPDGFHSRVLKELSSTIRYTTIAPWKDANLTRIQKKGPNISRGNYRPVSLTSVIGKIM